MDDSKLPYNFSPDPELQGLRPIAHKKTTKQFQNLNLHSDNKEPGTVVKGTRDSTSSTFSLGHDNFPPLSGGKSSAYRPRNKMDPLKQ